jgi:hypothetical protein
MSVTALEAPEICSPLRGTLGRKPSPFMRLQRSWPPYSNVPLVDVRRPARPNVGADHSASRADHPAAQRAHGHVIRQPIGVHGCAVVASARTAIYKQVPAAMAANVAQCYRLEYLGFAGGHHTSQLERLLRGRRAAATLLVVEVLVEPNARQEQAGRRIFMKNLLAPFSLKLADRGGNS